MIPEKIVLTKDAYLCEQHSLSTKTEKQNHLQPGLNFDYSIGTTVESTVWIDQSLVELLS